MTMREAEYSSLSPNALRVLEKRYLARDEEGRVTETPEALFHRVARTIAETDRLYGADEVTIPATATRFEALMRSLRFLPNSPTLMNAGKPHAHPQYSACFVIPIEDDMRSIGNAVTAAMLIHKTGGGTGFSFSRLRPKGDLVRSSGGVASGPVSFMRIFDAATEQVKQGSTRRGANMGILQCLAPDTKIHTLQGQVAICDLVGQQPYVYACDPVMRRVHVVRAHSVFMSGRNRNLVRVWLDDGQHMACTPDHRFLLADGSYRKAADLLVGDRLMAFKKAIVKHGTAQRHVYAIGCTRGRMEYEHRVVARDILREKVTSSWQVHHRDGNPLNNDPGNLVMVNRSDHAAEHMHHLKRYRQAIAQARKGKTLEEVYGVKKAAVWRKRLSEAHKKERPVLAENHRVVRVEPIGVADAVYDISLPELHNFVANGIFVHNCDHPDILEFIACKSQDGEIRNFNISVAVTAPFMEALERGDVYPLINPRTKEAVKTLPARQVWDLICESAWRNGDPGLFFIDRANAACPIRHIGEIESTNPCGEVPLHPWDACTLGSINLERHLVRDSGTGKYKIDWPALRETVHAAVHFLDNVIDANDHPLPEINEMTRKTRRIGLGVMGFARMLFALEIPYDSEAGLEIAAEVIGFIQSEGWKASEALAEKRGVYPAWKGGRHDIEGKRVRNAYVTCIAPTGTISMIADTSGGCEPEFSLIWHKHVLDGEDLPYVCDPFVKIAKEEGWWDEALMEKIQANHGSCRGVNGVPEKWQKVFATAHDITPEWHVRMQAAFQGFTDAAVSKTVNLPAHAMVDEVKRAYLLAYKLGCKGITVYRDGSRAGQVLNIGLAESKGSGFNSDSSDPPDAGPIFKRGELLELPDIVEEKRVRVRTNDGNAYIHIGFLNGKPAEIFAHPALGKYQGFIALACRLASTILRLGGTMEQVLEQFYKAHREYGDVSTPILALMKGIQQVMAHAGHPVTVSDRCPECGSSMRMQEGCMICAACGFSRC